MDIEKILEAQRAFFSEGVTRKTAFRRLALKKLSAALETHGEALLAALRADLGKSDTEGYLCELGMVKHELRYALSHVDGWAHPRFTAPELWQLPGMGSLWREPYGVALIMSPWNYPVQLTLNPLIGAIAAGNCAVVKPSAYAPATSAALKALLESCFPPRFVAVVEGGRQENAALLDQKFDYIFFTGGVEVGRTVLKKAAEHLTPVTLELGGKSPCIVDRTADLRAAARRIAFGKGLNAGQTCVAPDYVLVHHSVEEDFLLCLKEAFQALYGEKPLENPDYPRIVNQKHFDRLDALLKGAKVYSGGETHPEALQISPAILTDVCSGDAVMQEELFGPLLPVLPYGTLDEAVAFVNGREKPLALYLFTQSPAVKRRILREVSFGGGCVNDTVMHLTSSRLPFGGVGQSGMGAYHGKKSFETFSHQKSVLLMPAAAELPLRYPPYTPLKKALYQSLLK